MKKVCNKWKVFLIVFCMMFTMMPATVFADQPGDPPIVNVLEDQTGDQPQEEHGTTPDDVKQEEPGITPDDPGTPPDTNVTKSGIDVPDVQVLNMTPICLANLTINKIVEGNPPKDEEFRFKIKPEYGREFEKTITGNDSLDIPLLFGTYTVTEVPNDDYVADITSKTICLSWRNQSETVTFTNTYKPTTIIITKVIDGDKPDPESLPTFNFKIYKEKRSGDFEFLKNESIDGSGSTLPINVDPGKYRIVEIDDENDDYTPVETVKEFTVNKNEVYEAVFTNTYKDPTPPSTGSILITKDIQGDTPPVPADRFTFNIGSEGYTETVYITGEDSFTINNLTPGAYTITETNIPDDYTASGSSITVDVTASDTPKDVTFINIYDIPEPSAHITKSVALYDGVNIPSASSFTDHLDLTELNQQVIFKIEITCDDDWDGYVSLYDSYNGADITNDLQIRDGSNFLNAIDEIYDYPDWFPLNEEVFYTLYKTYTLTANGTYTNTAYLYESYYEPIPSIMKSEFEPEPIASSSATVVVNYTPPSSGGGGGSGGSHHYYEVTYNANYPVTTDTSGAVPSDTKNYSYNNLVNVKGNTGDLKVGNYVFDGWNTKADGTGTAYKSADTFNIKADTILYAQWKLADNNTVQDTSTSVDNNGNISDVDNSGNASVLSDNQLDDIPKTGDTTPVVPMLLLGFFSLAAIALFGRRNAVDTSAK